VTVGSLAGVASVLAIAQSAIAAEERWVGSLPFRGAPRRFEPSSTRAATCSSTSTPSSRTHTGRARCAPSPCARSRSSPWRRAASRGSFAPTLSRDLAERGLLRPREDRSEGRRRQPGRAAPRGRAHRVATWPRLPPPCLEATPPTGERWAAARVALRFRRRAPRRRPSRRTPARRPRPARTRHRRPSRRRCRAAAYASPAARATCRSLDRTPRPRRRRQSG